MAPTIPLEVVELIIDSLSDDRPLLLACALTSFRWINRSRSHLFRTLRIQTLRQLYSLHRTLTSDRTLGLYCLAVVIICNSLIQGEVDADGIRPIIEPHGAVESAMVLLRPYLPNLRSWSYEVGGTSPLYGLRMRRALLACHVQHANIQELTFDGIFFDCAADLARLLLSLPALQSLHLTRVHTKRKLSATMFTGYTSRLRASLRLTILSCCDISPELARVLQLTTAPSVEVLTMSFVLTDHPELEEVEYMISSRTLSSYIQLRALRVLATTLYSIHAPVNLDYLSKVLKDDLPYTVTRLYVDYSKFSPVSMFAYFDNRSPSLFAYWRKIDTLLFRVKDRYPGFDMLTFVWPKAAKMVIDSWNSALVVRLPKSAQGSLFSSEYIYEDFPRCYKTSECDNHPLALLSVSLASVWVISQAFRSVTIYDMRLGGVVSTLYAEPYCSRLTPSSSTSNHRYFVLPAESFGASPSKFTVLDTHSASDFGSEDWIRSNTRELMASLPGVQVVTHVCLSDGRIVFMGDDGVIRTIDIATGEETAILHNQTRTQPSELCHGAFLVSLDEHWLADWHARGAIRVWDLTAKAPSLRMEFTFPQSQAHEPEDIIVAAFSPDETSLMGVSSRGMIWSWDIATGIPLRRPLSTLSTPKALVAPTISFSAHGTYLAWTSTSEFVADRLRTSGSITLDMSNTDLTVLELFNPATKRLNPTARVLRGHSAPILAFSFSPDERYVATASADQSVRLWRTRDALCVRRFTEHCGRVTHVSISEDMSSLISGEEDGTVWIRKMDDVPIWENVWALA